MNKLGDAKKYLKRCIQEDGDIAQDLELGNSLDSFDNIDNVEENITNIKNNFTYVINRLPVYNLIKEQLESQLNYGTDITMINEVNSNAYLSIIEYSKVLEKINNIVQPDREWSTEVVNTYTCTDTNIPTNDKYYPKACKPIQKASTYSSNPFFSLYAGLINDMDNIVDYANTINPDPVNNPLDPKSVRDVIDTLQTEYHDYLDTYIIVLDFFKGVIHQITSIVREYTGDDSDSAFAFLNGKFIGTNLKIILKYLKNSLGKDFYTVGICLVVVGFSLILSISSTILLIIIINIGLKENIEREKIAKDTNNQLVSEYRSNYVTDGPKY